MVVEKIAGTSWDLAEMIVDYKKKTIEVIDGESEKVLCDINIDLEITPFFVWLIIFWAGIFMIIVYTDSDGSTLLFWLFIFQILITAYLIGVLLTPIRKKIHKFHQFFSNDLFRNKKFAVFKNIKTKIWKFPFDNFSNVKLDWFPYGDYGKYLRKVHIRPLDYYYLRGVKKGKKKWRQNEDWEVIFYFDKVPRKGRLEIVWI